MSTIDVRAEHPYQVRIGSGLLEHLVEHLPADAAKVLLVHPPALSRRAEQVAAAVRGSGRAVVTAPMPDGEAAKDLEVIAGAWDLLGEHAFNRSDVVLALGGGAVTDAAGFIAATWLRGVGVIHLPSTLLAMVDAAVGGKTGINTAAGKNLVGAFHSPLAVLCDLDMLATLPGADLRAGMAEVVKCGFIADERILTLLEADPVAALEPSSAVLAELVRRAITVKAGVVSDDFRESGRRVFLNYGHTLAHAIENIESYTWRHGDAVAVGMVFAAELAHRTGHLDRAQVDRHRHILQALDLPTTYGGVPWQQVAVVMARDKKSRAGTLRFVILDGIARPVLLTGPAPEVLIESFHALDGSEGTVAGPVPPG